MRLSNGGSVEATPEHPFFVQGKGFLSAKSLTAGMLLATLSGPPAKVAAVEPLAQAKPVYNFQVENTQTYFVGSNALWVHNQCSLRSKLSVRFFVQHTPNVARNDLSQTDYLFAQKISSYRGGRTLQGEINNYSPSGTLNGYDGWWDHVGGPKISLKQVGVANVRRVKEEAKRALERAEAASLHGQEIETFINAPLIDAKTLLGYIAPGQPLDQISTRNGTIKNIVIFCKNNVVVHLDPP